LKLVGTQHLAGRFFNTPSRKNNKKMKIEFEKITPPYSYPVSAADVKKIAYQCIPPGTNSGDTNSGDTNSGDTNSGDTNSGDSILNSKNDRALKI